MTTVEIYTDGACSGNPGAGGWGAVLRCGNVEKELSGGESQTTNNRMEFTAVIEALKVLKKECDIVLYTDSRYVMDGVTKWLPNWQQNGWRTANKKTPVKNIDLWQELESFLEKYRIKWVWVKGHNGHPENERCDELATSAADGESLLLDDGGDLRTEIPAPKDAVSGGKKTAGAGAEPLLPVVDEGLLAQALEGKLSTQKLETLLLQLQNRIDMEIEISEKLEEILEQE